MKLKINIVLFLLSLTSICYAQDWKTYPYNPAGQIAFPIDEGRHTDPIEWWYTSGHVTGATSGKEYSYMLTYFHYPLSGFDGFRILNITDHSTGEFFQDVKPLNYTTLSTTNLDIEAAVFTGATETWTNKLDISNAVIPFEYILSASSTFGALNFEYETLKRPLILGDDGYLEQGINNYTYYYSQTKIDVIGNITLNGTTEAVTGTSWIDRQYGDFNPLNGEKYEWFSMQLSNGMDINLWNIFTADRNVPDNNKYRILSAYVDENTQYTINNFEIERLAFNCMPDDEMCYSKQWRLTSDTNNLDLVITTIFDNSEVLLPFRFFEGSTTITGTVDGNAVTGIGFAELLHGYEHPDVTITSPVGGVYDTSMPITWDLNNPDDGRPIYYDLEYSIDNQVTFNPIVQNITSPSYLWSNPTISNGDDVWFKVIAYSIDGTLNNTVISTTSSSATLGFNEFNNHEVKLYPNPVDDRLILEFSNEIHNIAYEIIDLRGRVVASSEINNSSTFEIDTRQLVSGLYYLRIKTQQNQSVLRFVKK